VLPEFVDDILYRSYGIAGRKVPWHLALFRFDVCAGFAAARDFRRLV
jgi:hypothetical protein